MGGGGGGRGEEGGGLRAGWHFVVPRIHLLYAISDQSFKFNTQVV